MRRSHQRLVGLASTLFLGYFLFGQAWSAWKNYWLLKDPQQGMAVITKEHWSGHGRVVYRYSVNSTEYSGASSRNWQDPKYSSVQSGGQSVVYFSASHPWISLLFQPRAVIEGLPGIIIVLFFEFFAIMTIIKPGSGWAFSLDEQKTASCSRSLD